MKTEKYIGKYVGPNKIVTTEEVEDKTYLGNPKLKLVYENGKEMLFPAEVVEEVVTEEVSDLTKLRDARVAPVVEKILVILTESELNNEDMNHAIGPKLSESLNQSFHKAQKILWGKENYEVTLFDIDKILKSGEQTGGK